MPLTPNKRKAALVERGIKMATIARDCGVSRTTVSLVMSDERRHERVEEAVAKAIGKPVRSVFPPVEVRQSA